MDKNNIFICDATDTENHLDNTVREIMDSTLLTLSKSAKSDKQKIKAAIFYTVMLLCTALCAGFLASVSPWLSAAAAAFSALVFILFKGIVIKDKPQFGAKEHQDLFDSIRSQISSFSIAVYFKELLDNNQERINKALKKPMPEVITSNEQLLHIKIAAALEKENKEQAEKISALEKEKSAQAEKITELNIIVHSQDKEISELNSTIYTQTEKILELLAKEEEITPPSPAISEESSPCQAELPFDAMQSNEGFARWIQTFFLYTKRSSNPDLKEHYSQLKFSLEKAGIFVYDTLKYNAAGNVILPDEDYFTDWRSGNEWTEVTEPIIYTKDRVLIKGKIK